MHSLRNLTHSPAATFAPACGVSTTRVASIAAASQSVTTDQKANNTNLQPRATFATGTQINNIRCARLRAHTRRQPCLTVKYESTLPILYQAKVHLEKVQFSSHAKISKWYSSHFLFKNKASQVSSRIVSSVLELFASSRSTDKFEGLSLKNLLLIFFLTMTEKFQLSATIHEISRITKMIQNPRFISSADFLMSIWCVNVLKMNRSENLNSAHGRCQYDLDKNFVCNLS